MQSKMRYANKALAVFLSLGLCIGAVPMKTSQAATNDKFIVTNPISAMHVGRRYNFASTLNGKYADTSVTWTTSNASVATVDKYGNVITKRTGEFVITAKTKSGQKVAMDILSVSKSGLIDNQKDLERLLSSKAIKSIAIRQTERAKRFTIPEGNYTDKVVYINAGKSTLVNEGKLKKLTIVDLNKLQEEGTQDRVYIKDKEVAITVAEDAVINKLYIPTGNVETELTVDGTINLLLAGAKNSTLTMDGTGEITTTYVTPNGTDTSVTTSVLTTVKAATDVDLVAKEGAEGSKVELLNETVEVKVENQTSETIKVEGGTDVPAGSTDAGTVTPAPTPVIPLPGPGPAPGPAPGPGPAPTPVDKTATVEGKVVGNATKYDFPADFDELKKVVAKTTNHGDITFSQKAIKDILFLLDAGDATINLWSTYTGTKTFGDMTITVESTETPGTNQVTYKDIVCYVTLKKNGTDISIDAQMKGSSNTYTITREGTDTVSISCGTNSAISDLVKFSVTY